jgi:hypothetical protein
VTVFIANRRGGSYELKNVKDTGIIGNANLVIIAN